MTATEFGYWSLFVAWLAIPTLASIAACWYAHRTERKSDKPIDPEDDDGGNISSEHH